MDDQLSNRGGLEGLPFSYRTNKDGRVLISWRGQQAAVLTGSGASSFLTRIEGLDDAGKQLAMAKITGNFRLGNERLE